MNQQEWNAMSRGAVDELKASNDWHYNGLSDVFAAHLAYLDRLGLRGLYEPRRVSPPGGYTAFSHVAAGLFSPVGECSYKAVCNAAFVDVDICALAVVAQVMKYHVPVYYVAEAFARAVAATDLPHDFTLDDLHWPMPGMVLCFPTRFMHEYTGGYEVSGINAARFDDGVELTCPAPLNKQRVYVPKAKVGWHFYRYAPATGMLENFTASYHLDKRVDEAITSYSYTDYTEATDTVKMKEDENVLNKISALVMKLLVVLNTRPSFVVPGKVTRPAKMKHGKLKYCELWSPNVIGAAYKIMRGAPGDGTHASPHWHFRRGHLTHQRRGSMKNPDFIKIGSLPRCEDGQIDWLNVDAETKTKFWACHERKWLEPILVNLPPVEDAVKTF